MLCDICLYSLELSKGLQLRLLLLHHVLVVPGQGGYQELTVIVDLDNEGRIVQSGEFIVELLQCLILREEVLDLLRLQLLYKVVETAEVLKLRQLDLQS